MSWRERVLGSGSGDRLQLLAELLLAHRSLFSRLVDARLDGLEAVLDLLDALVDARLKQLDRLDEHRVARPSKRVHCRGPSKSK